MTSSASWIVPILIWRESL
uniref:Uncharacterized protein n=1 Tax=Arundo donax TaxID=35708 RepID=A0A0A8Z220_ARUDO